MKIPLVRRFLAYLLPVVAFLLIDHLLGRQWYSFPNDNIPGQFGLGLNLITGSLHLTFHHPAFPIIETASVLDAIFKDAPDLNGFFQAGRLVHLGVAIIASVWMARLAVLASLKSWQVALLSMTVLSMPTMALYAPLLVSYFPAGILLPPMAVALYLLGSGRTLPQWVAPSLYLVFGFQLSMLFSSLALLVALGGSLLMLLCAKGAENGAPFASVWPRSERLARLLLFLCLMPWVWNCLEAVQVLGPIPALIVTALVTLALLLVPRRYSRWWALQRGVVLPMLVGWLLGCNVLVTGWGTSAYDAFVAKGGASPHLPFADVWRRADLSRFIAAWHWHWFIVVLVISILALWPSLLIRSDARRDAVPFVAVFSTLALGLTIWIAADVSFLAPSNGSAAFGQESRYVFMIIAPVILVAVLGLTFSRTTSIMTTLVYSSLIVLSFADYYWAARAVWPEHEIAEKQLEEAAEAHIAASPQNTVWCLRTVQPRPCVLLYGFNNYRSADSLAKLDRHALQNGRIRYAADLTSACNMPDACQVPGQDFFVSDNEPPTATINIVQTEVGLNGFLLTRPWPRTTAP